VRPASVPRVNSIYGNPYFRLLRREVETLIKEDRGDAYLIDRQAKTELARITRELKRLKIQVAAMEQRKAALTAGFAGAAGTSIAGRR
jgi:hypothetical protein